MSRLQLISLVALFLFGAANAQTAAAPAGKTIEGFWQDTARRILFARDAPPSYAYGGWTMIDQDQTYPAAKQIRRSGGTLEVVDLNFDDANYVVKTLSATDDSLVFVRMVKWSGCAMHHQCRLEGQGLFCALESFCPENGKQVLDWRGEERYARRTSCERQGRVQAQGFPVSCR